jgi:hypothetical protein
MTALGIALMVCGLTLVSGSMIFLLFRRHEPASSQESFEVFRINDEMRRKQDEPIENTSTPAEHVPDDRKRRDE